MASVESPGTENLRADAHVFAKEGNSSPSGSGKDAGGTANLKETTTTKQAATKQTQTHAKDNRPAGVQHFNGGV